MPLQELRISITNRPIDVLEMWRKDEGGLLLDPPYQRGDVWGKIRRRNFIKSLLLGVPVPSIIVNQRMFAEGWGEDYRVAVIDGRQRITTIFMFLDDKIAVPSDWFHENHVSNTTGGTVFYSDLNRCGQRKLKGRSVPFVEARCESLQQEAEIFELINFGGVPQGCVDQDVEH